jgi:FlaA1/EpsC-like NDP-sugar epimerase
MGATKRIAELALERLHGGQLRLQAVRLGNVLGSTGSVALIFARQIAQGGPVTVTHPEAERYFFALDQAIDIVLRTTALGPGTFIPRLPPPMKISELADRMIRAARTEATASVQVKFTELRAGDKLREQFVHDAESCESTQDALLQRVRGVKIEPQTFDAAMRQLQELVEQRNLLAAMDILCELVPGYRPSASLLESAHGKSVAKS